jgi:hypothetical protein
MKKVMSQYIWRGWGFLAVAQAASIAEARALLDEECDGDGGTSTPIRMQAWKRIRESTPTIFHGPNSEFVLSESAETEEMLIHDKNKSDEIDRLRESLEGFYQRTGVIDNGYCAVCRIGYRKWHLPNCEEPAGPCSNEDCPTRIADELLEPLRLIERRRKTRKKATA